MGHSTVTSREMTASLQEHFDNVFAKLEENGMLIAWDSNLPDLTHTITGEKVRGSWWSHKLGHTIFAVSEMLGDHPDVLIMKLISGKVTFVHRKLWNRIYSIGVAREDWQLNGLTPEALLLLEAVEAAGSIQTYKLGSQFGPRPGDQARELESRMLIHGEQMHTESGRHSKTIETWGAWAKRAGFRPRASDPAAARRFLEQRLEALNKKHNGAHRLPWALTLKQS